MRVQIVEHPAHSMALYQLYYASHKAQVKVTKIKVRGQRNSVIVGITILDTGDTKMHTADID
jgi:hypothetical protein